MRKSSQRYKDISNQKFGKLTIIEFSHTEGDQSYWKAKCDCGETKTVKGQAVRRGSPKSCGCEAKKLTQERMTKHGKYGSPEYRAWRHMIDRCENLNHKEYKHYGARGITVCEAWFEFTQFYTDMGDRPSSAYSLERKDNSKGYSPENCIWATDETQNRNKRNNVNITYKEETHCVAVWAAKLNIPDHKLRRRLKRMSTEEALEMPYSAGTRDKY